MATCEVKWCTAIAADGARVCPVHRAHPTLNRDEKYDAYMHRLREARAAVKRRVTKAAREAER